MCLYCSTILTFTALMTLRKLAADELMGIPQKKLFKLLRMRSVIACVPFKKREQFGQD